MNKSSQRKGTAAILICVLMVPLFGLLAFSVDYGYLLFIKTDLQRSADQAVLAAVRDLVPNDNGNQKERKTGIAPRSLAKEEGNDVN